MSTIPSSWCTALKQDRITRVKPAGTNVSASATFFAFPRVRNSGINFSILAHPLDARRPSPLARYHLTPPTSADISIPFDVDIAMYDQRNKLFSVCFKVSLDVTLVACSTMALICVPVAFFRTPYLDRTDLSEDADFRQDVSRFEGGYASLRFGLEADRSLSFFVSIASRVRPSPSRLSLRTPSTMSSPRFRTRRVSPREHHRGRGFLLSKTIGLIYGSSRLARLQ